MYPKILMFLMASTFSVSACSASTINDCVDCNKKTLAADTMPDKKPVADLKKAMAIPMEMASKSALVIPKAGVKTSSQASYQGAYCMQFEQAQDTVDVEVVFEDMEGCPYSKNLTEFWITPVCHAPTKNDTTVPIIFNTANNPEKNENFPKVVHDYFVDDKKDPETWLKTINTTTSDGLTFLDFLQYNIQRGFYNKSSTEAAQRVVAYICKNGGVYSKYKDSKKCSE